MRTSKLKLPLFRTNWLLIVNHLIKNCHQTLKHYQNQVLQSNGKLLPMSLSNKVYLKLKVLRKLIV